MTIEVVFETHSLTEDNAQGLATGWLPGRLSAQGRTLAREIGGRRPDVAVVFSSDLERAMETARIAFAGREVPILADWRLRECDYGELNGAPVAKSHPRRPYMTEPYPGGESWTEAVTRVGRFVDELRGPGGERWRGKRVLVIGHVATRWGLDCALGGARLEELIEADFDWREGWDYRIEP